MKDFTANNNKINNVLTNINKVMIGKEQEAILSIVALLSRGHVLLEDVPGVGKTMLVRSIAKSLDASFSRIQFTPDLLPSDVTGVSIYNPKEHQFQLHPGPILHNVVLADEINRTSPKTQSALLEAMEEGSVTIDGETIQLNEPFFVMATQNPIEYEGTYPLPEAQLDRFIMKLKLGYPTFDEELELLKRTNALHPIETLPAVMTKGELLETRAVIQHVHLSESVKKYIVELSLKTRSHNLIQLGVSPRGTMALMKAAKAFAFVMNRDYVIPDDVKYLAPYVLSHRLHLTNEANYQNYLDTDVMEEIISSVPIPVRKG